MDWLYVIIIGALAGWLAGLLFRGGGFGLLGNIVIGIIGGFIGFWLLGKAGLSFGEGLIGTILTSVLGQVCSFSLPVFSRANSRKFLS